MNQKQGQIYGCLAETILLGLDIASESHSVGLLTPKGIRESAEMASRHGFGFEPWSQSNSLNIDPTGDSTLDNEAA